MEWNLDRVINMCKELSKQRGDEFSIPVIINGRLTATLGRVKGIRDGITGVCNPQSLEISKKLLEYGTNEDIEDTVKHEWCHYYLMKTTKENQGHNAMFKSLAKEVGCNGGTASIVEGYRTIKSKYEGFCQECGAKVCDYDRAGKVVKQTHLYKSQCCDAPIRMETNR